MKFEALFSLRKEILVSSAALPFLTRCTGSGWKMASKEMGFTENVDTLNSFSMLKSKYSLSVFTLLGSISGLSFKQSVLINSVTPLIWSLVIIIIIIIIIYIALFF